MLDRRGICNEPSKISFHVIVVHQAVRQSGNFIRHHRIPVRSDSENLPSVMSLPLPSVCESTMHDHMRRMSAGLRAFVLLAVAIAVAAHPFLRSFSLPHLSADLAPTELQVIICTAHGSVVIDDPLGAPPPAKQNPSCPWCAIAGGATAKLPALTSIELGILEPRELLGHRIALAHSILPPGLADWPAHAPRGPPFAVSV